VSGFTEMVHWDWVGWWMPLRVSFVPTEKAMACAMAAEEGQKWPQRCRQHPNSTEGAPKEQSRLNPSRFRSKQWPLATG